MTAGPDGDHNPAQDHNPDQDMQIDRFQMVDRVVALDVSTPSITAATRVPRDHSIFSGHFPGHPLLPGVLLSELMAQTCGFLLLSLDGFRKMPFLAALKEVKLRSFVTPATPLICKATREHDGSGFAVMRSEVYRAGEDKQVCGGTLTFRIVPYPNDELRQHMLDRAGEVGLGFDESKVILLEEADT